MLERIGRFMKQKKCRSILNVVALVAVGVTFLSNIPVLNRIQTEMIAGATFLMIIDLAFGFVFLRCPCCKKLLNFRASSQNICHNCGSRLEE